MPDSAPVHHVLDLGSRKFWRITGRRVDLEGRERWLDAPVSLSSRVTAAWLAAEAARHGGTLVEDDHPVIHTFHLAEVPASVGARALVRPPGPEMEEMVHGRSGVPAPARHAAAMAERERRDLHHEFATYRFRPVSEHGAWEGRTGIVPRP